MKTCIINFTIKYFLKLFSFLLLLFILNTQFSCKRGDNKLENHLKEIHKLNSNIIEDDWNVEKSYETNIEIFYSLHKKVVDTTYFLSFSLFKKNNKQNIKEFYYVDLYLKSYCDDSLYYELAQNIKDTLYMFKHPCIDGRICFDSLEFIMGKYYYMFRYNKFSGKQLRYYKLFKDSLNEIRGTDLPDLPR